MKLILTTTEIDTVKTFIANREGRLELDITDAEVFEYIEDKYEDEQSDIVPIDSEEQDYDYHQEPRSRRQILQDIITAVVTPDAYLAYI